jgi:biotin carboxylase
VTGGEVVVIVRDTGVSWVADLAGAARAAGCRVALVSGPDPEPVLVRLEQLVDRVSVLDDPTDPAAVARAAAALAAGGRLGAVVSGNDGCVAVAAQAAERLGLRRTPAGPIMAARNKYLARQVMAAAGVPGPRCALLAAPSRAGQVAAEVGLPAVVKPVNGTGSHLVLPVHSVAELAEAYRRLAARVPASGLGNLYQRPLDTQHGPLDPRRVFLVEGMLRGREFIIDLVVRDGRVEQLPLIDKVLIDDRYFELGFASPPFDLSPEREGHIRAVVGGAVRALGLDNTVAHVEVIDDGTLGPTIVEVNAGRPGGPLSRTLYQLRSGVDTSAELVAVARGVASRRTVPALSVPLAVLTLFPDGAGRLRAVHGVDDLAAHPDVVRVVPVARPGAILTGEHEAHGVVAVVAGFLDRGDLVHTYAELSELVHFELDPAPAGNGGAARPPQPVP